MTPYISTQNFNRQGHIRTLTVGFQENKQQVHFRFNRFGITSIKSAMTRGVKMSSHGDAFKVHQEAVDAFMTANDLVFKVTGATRWTQPTKKKEEAHV